MYSDTQNDSKHGFLSTFMDDGKFIALLLVFASLFFIFISQSIPPGGGPDAATFLSAYLDIAPGAALFRTFLSSWIVGTLAGLGAYTFHLSLLLLYLLYLLAAYYTARLLGLYQARIVTVLLLFHFQVTVLFHQLASDNLMALFLVLWSALVVRLYEKNQASTYAILGFATFLVVIVRPSGILFGFCALIPVVTHGFNKKNMIYCVVFLSVFVGSILGYASLNLYRNAQFFLAPASNMFPGVMIYMNGMMDRSAGPNSEKIFALVERELLDNPPYSQLDINVETFFSHPDVRSFFDLTFIDTVFDEGIMRRAAFEVVFKNPGSFFMTWMKKIYFMLIHYQTLGLAISGDAGSVMGITGLAKTKQNGIPHTFRSTLEGQEKSREHDAAVIKRWKERHSDPQEYDRLEADYKKRLLRLHFELGGYMPSLFTNTFLNTLLPPMLFFFLVGIPLILQWRKRQVRLILTMFIPAFGIVMLSSAYTAHPAIALYRMPIDFFFILVGVGGLMSSRFLKGLFLSSPST
ncbi:MAG: hypothetical protein HQL75_04105 [Magnetococcales bacterium]|nr:hypothetical protein [Magnetococcales bacterium]